MRNSMNLNDNLKFAKRSVHQCRNHPQSPAPLRLRGPTTSAFVLFVLGVLISNAAFADETIAVSQTKFDFDSCKPTVWCGDVGDGFRKHATEAGFNGGYGIGLHMFGGTIRHDMVLGDLHVG